MQGVYLGYRLHPRLVASLLGRFLPQGAYRCGAAGVYLPTRYRHMLLYGACNRLGGLVGWQLGGRRRGSEYTLIALAHLPTHPRRYHPLHLPALCDFLYGNHFKNRGIKLMVPDLRTYHGR